MASDSHTNLPFLKRVADDIVRRYGRNLGQIAIVFNNQRPVHYLKKHLAEIEGEAFWSPQFFTVQEFVRRASEKKELNRTAQVFLLNRLYTELQRENNPAFADALDQFFPIGEIILDDFAQLDYELVDVDMLFRELREIALLDTQFDFLTEEQQQFLVRFWSAFSKDRKSEMQARFLQLWQLLPQLYHRFRDTLEAAQQQTISGIYRELAMGKAGIRDVAQEFEQVLFVGFNALSASESKMFRRWQEQGKALFYFDADPYYSENQDMEAGYFIRQNIGNHGLVNALGAFPSQILGSVDRQTQKIDLIPAPGWTAQAKIVAQLIEKVAEESESIAILLADESLLVPVLQSIPESLVDQLNITMGYPMHESLTYGLIDLLLSSQQFYATGTRQKSELPQELLQGLLAHPFVEFKGRNQLNSEDHLLALQEQFPLFFSPATQVKELMEGLLNDLQRLVGQPDSARFQQNIERTLLDLALQGLRQMEKGFAEYPDLSLSLAINLIRRQLIRMTAPLSGDPSSPIQIMGLLESRNLNFDRIFIVGANEGNLPVLSASSSFIPYHLRRAYRLPVIDNQQALSAYLFYRLLHQFERLYLVYNAVVDHQNSGEVSRFVQQIRYESQLQVRTLNVHLGSLLPETSPAASQLPKGLCIEKTGAVWQRLQAYLKETPEPERRSLSASAFALYVNSPLEFFLKYIAGIQEPPKESVEMESNRMGNVIHRAMQLLYEPFQQQGKALQSRDIQQLLKQMPAACTQAASEEFQDTPKPGRPFTGQERIMLSISEEYCRIFLEHDRKLGLPIEILELENDSEQYRLEFPIEVEGRKTSVLLKGIIDRVDRVDGEMRIVDYKTGSDSLEVLLEDQDKINDIKLFNTNWKDSNKAFLQTLYYTFIYERISGQKVTPHLYSIRRMRTEGTQFKLKIPRKRSQPIYSWQMDQVKEAFYKFLNEKLAELFDPARPFTHPANATVYQGSIFEPYLNPPIAFGDGEEND